ncbi:diaminopimelate decarboxylase [Muribaculaceae bacterium]|nr:diaminopimelate decarboxylase [Muribaculaceae bacterium]
MLPSQDFSGYKTPFYAYDLELLRQTLDAITACVPANACVHYALKANASPVILSEIASKGFGADCVSGGEIKIAMAAGFDPSKIAFAGVGKTDEEILLGLEAEIGVFNVESREELEVIAGLAAGCGKVAPVALRVNPNIDAHTHHYITTGLAENKFGIGMDQLPELARYAAKSPSVDLIGLHFHIGSQILDMKPYAVLCQRINALQEILKSEGISLQSINVGGGLGIDYEQPDLHPVPDFTDYFRTITDNIVLDPGQTLHFELGRSVVAQCGSLITRVVYVKHGVEKKFVIVDAGMTELIRPALYGAHHLIQNLSAHTADSLIDTYDVVGPVCESSDVFATAISLPAVSRGDILAIRSAGAYGEVMASGYNCRTLNPSVYY